MSLWRRLGRLVYWLAWPALFIYLRFGARTRVIIIAEDSVLLVQGWMSDGRWGLPGGGLHHHESSLDGAVRETAEEVGVALQPDQCTSLSSEWWCENGLRFYCHFFTVRLSHRAALSRQRGEIIATQWIPLSELSATLYKAEVDRALALLAANN